jgi:hypothetical protein
MKPSLNSTINSLNTKLNNLKYTKTSTNSSLTTLQSRLTGVNIKKEEAEKQRIYVFVNQLTNGTLDRLIDSVVKINGKIFNKYEYNL